MNAPDETDPNSDISFSAPFVSRWRGVAWLTTGLSTLFELNGVKFHLRVHTSERLAAMLKYQHDNPEDTTGLIARSVAASVCDEHGNLILSGPEQVMELDHITVGKISDEILRINRLDK